MIYRKIFWKILTCFLILCTFSVSAQQVIVDEDFENPANVTATWSLNQVENFLGTINSNVNTFVVNDQYLGGNVIVDFVPVPIANTTDQGYQPNSNYLHTSAYQAFNQGVQNCTYLDQVFPNVNSELISAVSPDYSTVGYEGIDLSFWWFSGVSETTFGTYVLYSTNLGNTWDTIAGPLTSNNQWQQEVIPLNNQIDDLPNVRFAFVFSNELEDPTEIPLVFNGASGFGIDDFQLIADCDFSLPEDYTVCSGETTTINAFDPDYNLYDWGGTLPDNDNVTVTINSDTIFTISASNQFCFVQDTIEIFVQTERPNLNLGVDGEVNGIGISCFGDCTGQLSLEVIGATSADGTYNVTWLDSTFNPVSVGSVQNQVLNEFTSTLSGICEGLYVVQVTDDVCTVPETDTIFISQNSQITNNFVSDSLSCFGGDDGSITANPSGGVPPYLYQWGNNTNGQSISNLTLGVYTLVITDSLGCSESFSDTILQPNELVVNANILNEVSCYNGQDGQLTAVSFGGTGTKQYVWSHALFPWVDDPPYQNQTISNLPPVVNAEDYAINQNYQSYADPYVITVTDGNGCTSTSEIYLIEPPQLEIFLTQPTLPAYCDNNTPGFNSGWAEVSASGGSPNDNDNYNFVWNVLGQTDEDVLYSSIDNMNTGTYQVSVVDDRLCVEALDVFIDIDPTWQAYTSSIPTTCYGDNDGSATIQLEGGCGDPDNSCGFTFNWLGAPSLIGTFTNIDSLTDLQQGNYSVVVEDEWGCQAAYTIEVDGPTQVEFQITSLTNQTCFSSANASSDGSVELTITGGSSPYNVEWLQNSISGGVQQSDVLSTINGLSAGNWQVEVEDVNGCAGSFDFNSLNPNPFTILDGIEVSAEINSNPLFLTDTIKCFGDITGSAVVLNPNPNFEYFWHNANDISEVYSNGSSTNTLPAGDVAVTATYLGLCQITSQSVQIEENVQFQTSPVAGIYTLPSCVGSSDGKIDVTITGGTPFLNIVQPEDYNYSWFPAELNNQGATVTNGFLQFALTNLSAGTYYLQVVDRYGCDTVFTFDLNDPEPISVSTVVQNLSCHEDDESNTDGSITVNVTGGTPSFSYTAIGPLPSLANNPSVGNQFNNLDAGTYNVTVNDASGCSSETFPVSVTQPSPLDLSEELYSNVSCFGLSDAFIQLSSYGGTLPHTFEIDDALSQTNSSGLFQNLPEGDYTITLTDANNCTFDIPWTVNEPTQLSNPILIADSVSCYGLSDGSIDLTISGGTQPYFYTWVSGSGNSLPETEDLEFLPVGNYSVTVEDANGCTQTGNASIFEPQEVIAAWQLFTPGVINEHHIQSQSPPVQISLTDISLNHKPYFNKFYVNNEDRTNLFFNSFGTFDYIISEIGEYEIVMEVSNHNECTDTISLHLTIQGIKEINSFTPNGDGINDLFYIESFGIENMTTTIYNRLGDKVYQMNGPDETWNGISMNGLEVPDGVYFYVMDANGKDGSKFQEKGSVTIFR